GCAGELVTIVSRWTAMIPAFIGLVLVVCALVGMLHHIIGALLGRVVAIVGLAGTAMNVVELGSLFSGDGARPEAVITSTIAFILLVLYATFVIRDMVITAREHRNPAKLA